MKIPEFWTSEKVPKTEIRENVNTRKWPYLQYIIEPVCIVKEVSEGLCTCSEIYSMNFVKFNDLDLLCFHRAG